MHSLSWKNNKTITEVVEKKFDSEKVFDELEKCDKAKYHRGKSWEHCYVFFRNHKKIARLDHAALHLGFYLASWGMLRGSSVLLQQDYKFFEPIVKTLIDSKYEKLWDVDWSNISDKEKEEIIDTLLNLKDALEKKFAENNPDHKKPTDLLITKIIMGTMGCVPAYDQYLKKGLAKYKIKRRSNFNRKSFENFLNECKQREELKRFFVKTWRIKGTNYKYPPMKLLDLYFWLYGMQK